MTRKKITQPEEPVIPKTITKTQLLKENKKINSYRTTKKSIMTY